MQPLPIDPLLPQVIAHLSRGTRLVLRAPPGAGKTTRVPAALLDAGLAGDKQVVVLEPRRIAARAAAEYVASERGGRVGDDVGYRVRFEQRGGAGTRLWFVTEGILGRQLLRDPFLDQIGVIVLDEFHERHLQGDVALAVIRELQESVRPDLKLVVMSATLETDRLAAYLDGCAVLTSEGRTYPVRIDYSDDRDDRPLSARVSLALQRVLAAENDTGDVLVFLPGAGEIRRVAAAIEPLVARNDLLVVPLHGDLPLDAQRRAIRPAAQRKVVLSTNVAETALTIEGVTTVIDSGLAREARFDRRHGINTLRVVRISRAATEQRAGRAGRTAPGRCIRLWNQNEHAQRRPHETPEILRLDLSATVLELRAWALSDVTKLRWLDPPGEAALQCAERLLRQLGAVDESSGSIIDIGRRILELSAPPRLARILVEAERHDCAAAGSLLAALASERDICAEQRALSSGTGGPWAAGPSDLLLRMRLFEDAERRHFDRAACEALGLEARTVRAVERARRQLLRTGSGHSRREHDPDTLLRCILAGFPDRVVRRRERGAARGLMVGGTGVVLAGSSVVRDAELFVAVEVEGGPRRERGEALVRIASAIESAWLGEMFPAALHDTQELVFDASRERVVERIRRLFHDLVLSESERLDVDPLHAGELLAEAARRDPVRALNIGEPEQHLLERVRFLQRWMPELGLPSDTNAWLSEAAASICAGKRSFGETRKIDALPVLRGLLTPQQGRTVEREAPERYRLPSSRLATVTYDADKPPAVAARIQELFGLIATPRLAAGRVALVFQLLAPNQRPVQITDDLESFWRRTYPEIRKVLRGRYPKHAWPEDPLTATPTVRTGRRS